MKTNRVFSIVLVFVLCFASIPLQAQAQQPVTQSNTENGSAQSGDETQLSNLVAQARLQRRAGFALMPQSYVATMPESYVAGTSGSVFSISPAVAANLTVLGSGTLGRLTKWTGFTSRNSFIGDTGIFESKTGLVGIGTDTPTAKLTVAGVIYPSRSLRSAGREIHQLGARP